MKSFSSEIGNFLISGSAIIMPGSPPNFLNFASISPNVLDTDSLPGFTLTGPRT